jgi:hypothetical protein
VVNAKIPITQIIINGRAAFILLTGILSESSMTLAAPIHNAGNMGRK